MKAAAALRTPTLVIGAAVLWTLAWYLPTASAMVGIWARSATFNHGFIVAPIALWLVWRRQRHLAAEAVRPAPWLLPLTAGSAAVWLLGDLAGVNALTQFALVALLVLAVPTLLGVAFARAIAFPLAFLFFMVPVGDFALPTLMDWTAEFTVLALRATGIPVYQEGLQFVIPSGRWSVVEACSGVRYLIASACVGFLFAYLSYVSPWRRITFAAVSLLVPVVANWLRAYLIVMLGHLSNGEIATGVDHLIYGWIFFGIVILIMFAIGARWAERDPWRGPEEAAMPVASHPAAATYRPATLVAFALIVMAPHLALTAIERLDRAGPVRLAAPGAVPGWVAGAGPTTWHPAYVGPDAVLRGGYAKGGAQVGLQVVYYRGQDYARKLVNSNNVLVRSDDPAWASIGRGARALEIDGAPARVGRAELRGPDDRRLVIWHWYWINGRTTASPALAKFYLALERLRGRGDDAAGVFVFTTRDDPTPEATLESFLRAAAGPLQAALEHTREDR